MASMMRSRANEAGEVSNELMAKYYSQRTSAGIIVTEVTQISKQGMGYARASGIFTKEQIEGWNLTTNIVYKNKGEIFFQLWHFGRVGSLKVNGLQPILGVSRVLCFYFI